MISQIKSPYLMDKIVKEVSSGNRNAIIYNIGYLKSQGVTDSDIASFVCEHLPFNHARTLKEVNWIKEPCKYFKEREEKPIRRNTFLFNNNERSESNISFNPETTKHRYDLIPDDDKNKSFFKGANIIAYGYKKTSLSKEEYNIHSNKFYKYNPSKIPVYRSIGGVDHVLFVADIDRKDHNNSLFEASKYVFKIKDFWKWDIIKFSGSEGFHLIKYLPKETSVDDLRAYALQIDPDKNKLDWHLFNDLNWKIRGYCVNLKTGKMSKDITLLQELKK